MYKKNSYAIFAALIECTSYYIRKRRPYVRDLLRRPTSSKERTYNVPQELRIHIDALDGESC